MDKCCACGCGCIVKKGNKYINGHNKSTLGKKSKFKGINYRERFGCEKAGEISRKIRIGKMGDKNPAKRLEVRKRISEGRKGKLVGDENPNYWKGRRNLGQSERMRLNNPTSNPEVREKLRERVLNNFYKNGDVKIGKNETKLLDDVEKLINERVERQFRVGGYSVDGYIEKLNLVIEVDESHHYKLDGKLREKDVKRQNIIKERLNCDFIRIKDTITLNELKNELKMIK